MLIVNTAASIVASPAALVPILPCGFAGLPRPAVLDDIRRWPFPNELAGGLIVFPQHLLHTHCCSILHH